MPTKQHRDFVILVKNGVEINALVAMTQDVTTPATQEVPAFTTEHLTLVYLDPASARPRQTGDQLRASIQTVFDVPPLTEGRTTGWKDVVEASDSGDAFTAAIQWREYAASLEKAYIADGHPNLVRIASDEMSTEPPTHTVVQETPAPPVEPLVPVDESHLATEGHALDFVATDKEALEAFEAGNEKGHAAVVEPETVAEVPPVGLGGPVE